MTVLQFKAPRPPPPDSTSFLTLMDAVKGGGGVVWGDPRDPSPTKSHNYPLNDCSGLVCFNLIRALQPSIKLLLLLLCAHG